MERKQIWHLRAVGTMDAGNKSIAITFPAGVRFLPFYVKVGADDYLADRRVDLRVRDLDDNLLYTIFSQSTVDNENICPGDAVLEDSAAGSASTEGGSITAGGLRPRHWFTGGTILELEGFSLLVSETLSINMMGWIEGDPARITFSAGGTLDEQVNKVI